MLRSKLSFDKSFGVFVQRSTSRSATVSRIVLSSRASSGCACTDDCLGSAVSQASLDNPPLRATCSVFYRPKPFGKIPTKLPSVIFFLPNVTKNTERKNYRRVVWKIPTREIKYRPVPKIPNPRSVFHELRSVNGGTHAPFLILLIFVIPFDSKRDMLRGMGTNIPRKR